MSFLRNIRFIVGFAASALVLLVPWSTAQAQQPAEQIVSFDARVEVRTDRSLRVEETIVYDFGAERRRGIYRDIPYRSAGRETPIDIESVQDAQGQAWSYSASRQGDFVRVKIGKSDVYLGGQQTYRITYVVREAVLFFDDHEELYWNVTGDGWNVPIGQASARVHLPTAATATACYTGVRGSKATDCSVTIEGNAVAYATRRPLDPTQAALGPNEGLTVVAGMPQGTIAPMSQAERNWNMLRTWWPAVLPVLTLLGMAWVWRRYGRDPATGQYVAPMYDAPDSLAPAEVGVVWDERVDRHDVSATLVDLAVRGYLTIREVENTALLVFKRKDYVFTRTKEADAALRPFERLLFDGIFDGATEKSLSDLKTTFFSTYERVRSELSSDLTRRGYFARNPNHVRNTFGGIALALGLGGIVGGILTESVVLGLGAGLSGIIVAAFATRMPRRTLQGARARLHVAGLKLYLQRAEKRQIEFHNAPAKKPETFERLLPYAMVLQVEEAWAKEFADIYQEPPHWYQSSAAGHFQLGYMMGSLHSFAQAAEAALPAKPSSSGGSGLGGGGFSGGGFGGGGGGSW